MFLAPGFGLSQNENYEMRVMDANMKPYSLAIVLETYSQKSWNRLNTIDITCKNS